MLELVCVCIYWYNGRTWYLVAIAIAKVVLPSLHRGIVEFDILVCLTLAFDTLQDTAHYIYMHFINLCLYWDHTELYLELH